MKARVQLYDRHPLKKRVAIFTELAPPSESLSFKGFSVPQLTQRAVVRLRPWLYRAQRDGKRKNHVDPLSAYLPPLGRRVYPT